MTLHIGLPETATTFLQWAVLDRTDELLMLHRKQGDNPKRI